MLLLNTDKWSCSRVHGLERYIFGGTSVAVEQDSQIYSYNLNTDRLPALHR